MSPACVIRSRPKRRVAKPKANNKDGSTTEFTFINLSEPSQSKDKDLKRAVRSKAMRAYSQMEKQKASTMLTQKPISVKRRKPSSYIHAQENRLARPQLEQAEAQDPLLPNKQVLGVGSCRTFSRSRRSTCSHKECNKSGCLKQTTKWTPSECPQALIGNGMNDPFDAYPIRGCPRYNAYVLNHCKRLLLLRAIA